METRGMEDVFAAAARLQELVPDTVLAGDSAAVRHAGHRISLDDDHVVRDLRDRFDDVLADLEATEGWITARVQRPVLILGRLDGVETGIRNLVRRRALEVEEAAVGERSLRVPTLSEMARVKAWLCLMRNATRDYGDFAALADRLGDTEAIGVIVGMDCYYSDQLGPGGRRVATQVARQLAEPLPDDLSEVEDRWRDWGTVADACRRIAVGVLDRLAEDSP